MAQADTQATVTPFTVKITGTRIDATNVVKTTTTTEQYSNGTHTKTTQQVIKVVLPNDNAEDLAEQLEAERQQLNDEHDTDFPFDIRVTHANAIGGEDAMSQICHTVSARDDTLTFSS